MRKAGIIYGAACLALLLAHAASGAAKTARPRAPRDGGWTAARSSLLLFDKNGKLIDEVGIGDWEVEIEGGLLLRRHMRGGTSRDGRFAWHWQKLESRHMEHDEELVASTTTLVYMGTRGQILWQSAHADAPLDISPLTLSRDGETFVAVEHHGADWVVNAYTFTGNLLMGHRPVRRLEQIALTGSGRHVMILWSAPESALVYTILDLKKRTRKDIPASEASLGQAELREDGAVVSDGRVLYRP